MQEMKRARRLHTPVAVLAGRSHLDHYHLGRIREQRKLDYLSHLLETLEEKPNASSDHTVIPQGHTRANGLAERPTESALTGATLKRELSGH